MEPLIAVYSSTERRNKGDKPVVLSGWSWIKSTGEAIDKCKKKLSDNGELLTVHVCKWRESPSEYKQVYGTTNCAPMIDMAANIRAGHLKKSRKQIREELGFKRKQIANTVKTTFKPSVERFVLITASPAA